MTVRSFDLFDTLVAARDTSVLAGDADSYFPIAENVAKVQPGDIVVSDYYDEAKATRLLRDVCGLSNRLYVTESGKADGSIWRTLKQKNSIESHTGDNAYTDVASAKAAGIPPIHYTGATPTSTEIYLARQGLPRLAQCIREARLTHPGHPAQTQVNFPFLFCASILLHRKAERASDVMMSSRDCWLWVALQDRVRTLLDGSYRVHYYQTSRIARTKASPGYIEYTNALMGTAPLVVDLCGFGVTLPQLVRRTSHPNAPIYIAVKYPYAPVATTVSWSVSGDSRIESHNLAPHSMVVDVVSGEPTFYNPAGLDWLCSEVMDAHKAFHHCLDVMSNYDLSAEFALPSERLTDVMAYLFKLYPTEKSELLLAEEASVTSELRLLNR